MENWNADYILAHTPREICRKHSMDEIEAAFKLNSPIPFASLQRIAFNSGFALAIPPLDKKLSPNDYTDSNGPDGEIITAEQFAVVFTLFYALDQKRYEVIC